MKPAQRAGGLRDPRPGAIGAVVSIVALVLGTACERTEDLWAFLLQRRDVRWRGITVQVDSNYVLSVQRRSLRILRYTPRQMGAFGRMVLHWDDGTTREREDAAWCLRSPDRCRLTTSLAGDNALQCLDLRALSDSTLGPQPRAFRCWLVGSGLSARSFCFERECEQFMEIAVAAFASFRPSPSQGSR